MTTPTPHLPAARAGNGTRVVRLGILLGSFALAIGAVIAGRSYQRPEPKPDEPAPGMTLTCTQLPADKCKSGSFDAVALASDAPQWAVIATKLPDPPEPRWSEPLPARVLFDESRTSRLGAPLAGRVSSVFAERGQTVKAGAPLYAVSSASLTELRSAEKVAEVEKDTAQKNYDRTKTAVDAQVLPGKELVAAKQKLDEAEVALKLTREKLSSLKVTGGGDTAAFTVVAPRDGVVVEKTVAVGQTVSPDAGSLMAIADLSTVWVVADIFGTQVVGLARGTRVRVVIGNGANNDRDAVIDQVAAVVDPERHTVPVRIKLDNPDGTLRPNAYVQVRLFDPRPISAMLPASAVMSDGAKSDGGNQKGFVYIEQPKGVFKRRDIEVGSVIGGRVPVTAGIGPTDRVVVEGAILIDNEIALDN